MKIKQVLTFCLTLALFACTTTPSHIIVAPDMMGFVNQTKYNNKTINLAVQDLRTSAHIVQIMQKDKAAVLVNSQTDLAKVMKASLVEQYAKQGLTFNSQSSNQLEIKLVSAIINVDQTVLKYSTKTQIEFAVIMRNGEQILTKNFRQSGSSNGPLSPDLAVLGRDFNQQLTKALSKLVNDVEIQNLVK